MRRKWKTKKDLLNALEKNFCHVVEKKLLKAIRLFKYEKCDGNTNWRNKQILG